MIKNKALTFTVTVYAVTALYSLLYLKFPLAGPDKIVPGIITSLYMFIPLVCAAALSKLVYREGFRESVSLKFKWSPWYFLALLMPVANAFLSFGAALLMPGVSLAPDMSGMLSKFMTMLTPEQYDMAVKQSLEMKEMFKTDYYYLIVGAFSAIVAGATINAVFGFGEEAGWRGFLFNSLKGLGFYRASLLIGVIWGIWHLPVIIQGHNYGEHRIAGIFMMTAWTVLLTPVFNYAVLRTGSVLAAAIMHGVLNASPGIALAYIKGGNELTVGITGAAGFISLLVINTAIYIYERYIAREKVIF